MKKNGSAYFTEPNFIASIMERMTGAPARLEAATTDRATGGVISERTAQYRMKRCTATGFIPCWMSAGATMMARKMYDAVMVSPVPRMKHAITASYIFLAIMV